jgi:hypothetical protein
LRLSGLWQRGDVLELNNELIKVCSSHHSKVNDCPSSLSTFQAAHSLPYQS